MKNKSCIFFPLQSLSSIKSWCLAIKLNFNKYSGDFPSHRAPTKREKFFSRRNKKSAISEILNCSCHGATEGDNDTGKSFSEASLLCLKWCAEQNNDRLLYFCHFLLVRALNGEKSEMEISFSKDIYLGWFQFHWGEVYQKQHNKWKKKNLNLCESTCPRIKVSLRHVIYWFKGMLLGFFCCSFFWPWFV